jgi:Protein of unknown function (DUF3300)
MSSVGSQSVVRYLPFRIPIFFLCVLSLPIGVPVLSAQQPELIPNEKLDALVAPIALYPDPLLAQTLAASTYPLEVIQLQQWMANNSYLKDQALADAVWLLLLCVAGCGLWLVSYQAGTSGRRSVLDRFVFPILVAIVIVLITDIDTPRGGLISLDERPFLELNEALKGSSTATRP